MKGVTLQQDPWHNYGPEIAALDDLQPDSIVMLVFDLQYEATLNHRQVVLDYLSRHPGTRLMVRPMAEGIITFNPKDWAAECKKRIDWLGVTTTLPEVIPGNEFNVEGGGENWDQHNTWLISFAGAWQDLQAPYPTHCPALSPTGNYQEGMNAYARSSTFDYFDAVDLHIYSPAQYPDATYIPVAPGKPKVITEFNQILPGDFFTAMADKVDEAVYFLLGGTPDWVGLDLLNNPTYDASFKNWQSGGSPVVDPTPTPAPQPTLQDALNRIAALEQRDHDLVELAIALREGRFEGAGSVDGYIAALRGGTLPDGYAPVFPPKA